MDSEALRNIVPAELKARQQWVCWKLEEREGKTTKVPYNVATGKRASSTNATTWVSFEEALAAAESGRYSGIGFMFAEDRAITGLDLDHVLDTSGCLANEYFWVVKEAATYTEVSPSGDGLHLFFLGGKPEGSDKCKKAQGDGTEVEMYDHARFFTFTGNVFVDAEGIEHSGICSNPEVLAKAYRTWLGDIPNEVPVEPLTATDSPTASFKPAATCSAASGACPDDAKLIEKMFSAKNGAAMRRLWDGDTSDHNGDDSAADLALCNQLAFWAQGDGARMDRLFRQSGLMRPKWDEIHGGKTYGEITIGRAIADVKSSYDPNYRSKDRKRKEEFRKPQTISGVSIWKNPHLEYKVDDSGNITGVMAPTVPALVWWMAEDPGLEGVRLESMSQQITVDKGLPWNNEAKLWQAVDDDYLYARMQERYVFDGKAVVRSDKNTFKAFSIFSNDNRYDMLRETLADLPPWDGVLRKDRLFIDFLGAEDTEYTREVTALFLRAALARAYRPGCKYDHMVVLQGEQGIGKSTLLHLLALRDEFFADDVKNIGTKDAQELIQGRWIIEMAELAAFKGTRIEPLKQFITSQNDCYRVPYAKRPQQLPRRCVLAGSTNLNEYLEDPTGNRRFLPVICNKADISHNVFGDGVPEYIEQVWAEAIVDYRANPEKPLVLPQSVAADADRRRIAATVEDPWIGLIERYLAEFKVGSFVCTMKVLVEGIGIERKEAKTADNMRVSQIIRTHCPDWSRAKSNRVIPDYGSQRAFVKIELSNANSEGVQQCFPGV